MKKVLSAVVAIGLAFMACIEVEAWDGTGYNYDTGDYNSIEVEAYDHQYRGEGPVSFFDYSDGEYKTGWLDMYPGGTGTIYTDDGEMIDVDMD